MNRNDQQFMAQKIRTQYMEKQPSELDALRALDARVKRPAHVFAYVFGSLSAIIMGAGMSLVMTEIGAMLGMASTTVPGIVIGVLGMAMAIGAVAALAYPVYNAIAKKKRKKLAPEILRLADELMK